MCDLIAPVLAFIASLALAFLGGYLASILKRRFDQADIFCGLILREIKEASELHDNIGGEFCIGKWHTPSSKRIEAYAQIVDWSKYTRGSKVLTACKEYQNKEVGLNFMREDMVSALTNIYRLAKQTT